MRLFCTTCDEKSLVKKFDEIKEATTWWDLLTTRPPPECSAIIMLEYNYNYNYISKSHQVVFYNFSIGDFSLVIIAHVVPKKRLNI